MTTNYSKRGRRSTFSLRGTGLSYTTKTAKSSGCGCALPVFIVVMVGLALGVTLLVRDNNEQPAGIMGSTTRSQRKRGAE